MLYVISVARSATPVTPASALSAVEALHVGTQDGCNVYAVKRGSYWTAVQQTMPQGSKIASFPVVGRSQHFSSARACVGAIRETLRARIEDSALVEALG